MGWRLAEECQKYAPDNLTFREMYVLCILAGKAFDSGKEARKCPKGVEKQPDIIKRMRCGRSERFATLAALVDKGALLRFGWGGRDHISTYEIPEFERPDCLETEPGPEATSDQDQCPGNPDTETKISVRVSQDQCPENPDTEREDTLLSITNTHQGARAESAELATSLFDAFWKAYPKKHDKIPARKAWDVALKRQDAEPELIIKAAEAYAADPGRRRGGARFTKLPATWLNAGSYLNGSEPPEQEIPSWML